MVRSIEILLNDVSELHNEWGDFEISVGKNTWVFQEQI